MRVEEYVKAVRSTDQTISKDGQTIRILGLAGEIGSLLAELKKDIREKTASPNTAQRVSEELGDITWYVTALGNHSKCNLRKDILHQNLLKIRDRSEETRIALAPLAKRALQPGGELVKTLKRRGVQSVQTFRQYQQLAVKTSLYKRRDSLLPFVARIWSHSAELLEKAQNSPFSARDFKREEISEILGDVMWYVANVAYVYHLNLDDVVSANVKKTRSRWPGRTPQPTPLFDKNKKVPELEKLPRRFEVRIIPKNPRTSVMMINGVLVGDPLTDNSWEPDGYRFHDVIHLAHAAVLGWSPVFRRIMNRKRKYCRQVDEVEDGARAAIVEEAIAKITHSYAQRVDRQALLDNQKSVSFELLKQLKILTHGLEVDQCQYWEWEKAILSGHKIFNQLRRNPSGVIHVDLHNRSIRFRKAR